MEKYFKKEYLLLLLFITSLPSIIYFLNFVCSDIKNTPETWAQFGDFVGGTTGIIIGFFNILATIILALVINNYDNKRNKDSLDLQKKIFERELKENAYKEFNILVKSNEISPYNTIEYIEYLYDFNIKISNFYYTNSHIFESITKYGLEKRTFDILDQLINDLDEFEQKRGIYYKDKKKMPDIFKERNKLFSEINYYFIDEIKKATLI
ncbi:hypothetical protein HXZ62_05020 [Empedobacter falsenii]|uniref:hypothetical protein n=1 Tax=Empedobacter falsenii TaxID=343874 RepID=UPI002576E948|nr:hypothetical protein [Empedobacter falsenii]MDM1061929.1 hypothetical protein [Empedobacter falsenii]